IHELADPRVTAVQEAYVREVIRTVNDLDNVLFEISNENHPPSTDWQYHMIELIRRTERAMPKQHPVGMTFQYQGGSNQTLFDSPADWISPNPDGGYRDDPPAADGTKVIINDTDHLWGIGGNAQWVWKSFCRGLNPIFMDPYDGAVIGGRFEPRWDPVRKSLGQALALAERLDLARMTPHNALASTGFCLADPGVDYIVYLPDGGVAELDLSAAQGGLSVEWIDASTGAATPGASVDGGGRIRLAAPFAGNAVIHVWVPPAER
ncbi:MAG TPA: hypothetical protein PLQ54_06570, partial [Armatimonadota bacterium]|nr:hypothetical protein [Armatimonadota bacterium]